MLPQYLLEEIFARAVRALTSRSGEHRGWQLARNLMNSMGLTPQAYGYASDMSLHNAVWTAVRQAAAAMSSGTTIGPQSNLTPNPPRIPGIPDGSPNYEYRVVVTVRDATGETAKTAVTIRSDVPLAYGSIVAQATEMVANITPRRGRTPGKSRILNMTDYNVTNVIVVWAGRRE